MKEMLIYKNRKKQIATILILLAFFLVAALLFSFMWSILGTKTLLTYRGIVFAIGIISTAVLLLIFIPDTLKNKPGLILNDKGIYHLPTSKEFISWKEMLGVKLYKVDKFDFASISVKNPNKIIKEGGLIKKIGLKINFDKYDSPVQISLSLLKTDPVQLVNTIREQIDLHKNQG